MINVQAPKIVGTEGGEALRSGSSKTTKASGKRAILDMFYRDLFDYLELPEPNEKNGRQIWVSSEMFEKQFLRKHGPDPLTTLFQKQHNNKLEEKRQKYLGEAIQGFCSSGLFWEEAFPRYSLLFFIFIC